MIEPITLGGGRRMFRGGFEVMPDGGAWDRARARGFEGTVDVLRERPPIRYRPTVECRSRNRVRDRPRTAISPC